MSTRSYIAIERQDGTYDAVYCHFDGYVEGGVGEALYTCYNNRESAEEIISLGNRRSLNEPPLDNKEDLYENEPYTKFKDLDKLRKTLESVDYLYIWGLDDKWRVITESRWRGHETKTQLLQEFFK